jgi:starch phosphorylase
VRAIRRFTVRTVLPEPLAALGELALNLRWSWHPPTRDLFFGIDEERWAAAAGDPVRLLGMLSPEELARLAADTEFVARVRAAADDLHAYLTTPGWYRSVPDAPAAVAYFSPEFGIAATLPQYSGGLGILAGDHLKAASDLGVPIVGVGLFYKTGYFRQSLSRDGWQQETYPVLDPNELPLSLLREADGTPVEIAVGLPEGRTLHARVWRAQVGRIPLLLLDSDTVSNDERARAVTDRLYGGSKEHRIQQEMLLGIGGVRAVRAFSRVTGAPAPEVFHSNEGHAGFLGLERIRELVADGLTFAEAVEAVRAGTVFTTHTPVPAGIDRFDRDLVASYLGDSEALSGLDVKDVLALGAEDFRGGDPDLFNMAVMGLRLAQRANGVSKLHGVVSRDMFGGLYPGFDSTETPITSITNGVHAATWVSRGVIELGSRLGAGAAGDLQDWGVFARAGDAELWQMRRAQRERLVEWARARLRLSWRERGASPAELGWIDSAFDPDVLTIGFARRVPTYKRLTLMLRDPERLRSLLLHPTRPVQIIIGGKSHPADEGGKRLIQQVVRFADDAGVRHRIAFLPNYDIAMARRLYPGCDVWLNNPLRPLEACGTSGMKAALNGGLNLSILDGWWDEWFDGQNGWAIPTADGVDDPDHRDDLEARALYDIVESSVAPRFYDRDEHGLPGRWLQMVRHTLSTLGPKVLAGRMVREYVEALYAPAAAASRALDRTPGHDGARALAAWKQRVVAGWHAVRVDHVSGQGIGDSPQVGDVLTVEAVVSLGGLDPGDVRVELVHGTVSESDDLAGEVRRLALEHVGAAEGGPSGSGHRFAASLPLARTGAFGYTVRVLPHHAALADPAELGLVANAG